MSAVAAILFTLHVGLGASPMHGAAVSLREEALTVAAQSGAPLRVGPDAGSLAATVEPQPARRVLTRDDWFDLLGDALDNEKIANAAMWIATQPLSVTMTPEKVFVSVRFATP